MTTLHAQLWNAINEYAAACGGDTSDKTIGERRMQAVAAVEKALRDIVDDETDATIEAGHCPDEGCPGVIERDGSCSHCGFDYECERGDDCAECQRSFGPHYRGPCNH